MVMGRVKFYNVDKGFGFIIPDEGGDDVFVHARDLESSDLQFLGNKQKVSYELREHKGKFTATKIKVLD
jgi:CspA family cold shock protein